MQLSSDQAAALGVALNEATLLGVEVDVATRRAAATFAVLSLPLVGPARADPRVQFVFEDVRRVAASLRHGQWDDATAPVETFEPGALLSRVQSFAGLPIYGWEFFDVAEQTFPALADRLSFDITLGGGSDAHSLSLFQAGPDRHLDLWLWFDRFTILTATGQPLELEEFAADGQRWWDAFYRKDPRTTGRGMIPLS